MEFNKLQNDNLINNNRIKGFNNIDIEKLEPLELKQISSQINNNIELQKMHKLENVNPNNIPQNINNEEEEFEEEIFNNEKGNINNLEAYFKNKNFEEKEDYDDEIQKNQEKKIVDSLNNNNNSNNLNINFSNNTFGNNLMISKEKYLNKNQDKIIEENNVEPNMMDNFEEYEEYEINGKEEYQDNKEEENYDEYCQNQENEQDEDYIEEQFNQDIKDENNAPNNVNDILSKDLNNKIEKKGPIDG